MKNELEFCLDYLKMQKIRFDTALNYVVNIEDEIVQTKFLPYFSLQPLVENILKHNDNPIDLLSDRYLEMVEYLVIGLGAKEKVNKMNMVLATVKHYKNQVFKKFGVQSNAELKDKFLLYKEQEY